MTYSYTQISQYLNCPRRYRHRYLDGWQEKDTCAAMLCGRAFEQAVAALFRREDPAAVLFEQWGPAKSREVSHRNRPKPDLREIGLRIRTWASPTRATTPGTECCNKASSCSSASLRTAAFAFGAHIQPSRFSSIGHLVLGTISSPTSTLLANSTAHPVCWSGKPRVPGEAVP